MQPGKVAAAGGAPAAARSSWNSAEEDEAASELHARFRAAMEKSRVRISHTTAYQQGCSNAGPVREHVRAQGACMLHACMHGFCNVI